MRKQVFATVTAAVLSTAALLVLLTLLSEASPAAFSPALAAPLQITPTVALVRPCSAPNDLDASVVVTGTGFVSTPTAYLGGTPLDDVTWVSTTTLEARVPWGMAPGAYTLTVFNPDQQSGALSNAFTVTQGIGVWNTGELHGGAIGSIAINPITPTTLYARADKVGLFRSRDAGDNWSFLLGGLGLDSPAVVPSAPETLYAARWTEVYRSDDEGETWNRLTTEFPVTYTTGYQCWGGFEIHPHPTAPGTVYVHSCDNSNESGGGSGLIKSTNWGQDWQPATDGLSVTQATALAFHPENPEFLYLGTAGGHIFHSEDGGDSWVYDYQPLEYVAELAVDPFGAHDVWISSRDTFGAPCALLKSAGADLTSWTAMEPDAGGSNCFLDIDFSPTTSGTVYVNHSQPYKTTDGGSTWDPFIWVPFDADSPYVFDIALHPTLSTTIYFGESKVGVQRTTDGGATWEVVNQGLTALFPQQMQVPRSQPDTVYARMEWAGVYEGTQGGHTWQQLPISNVDSILIDPLTPTQLYATSSRGCTPYVFTSADSGQTWEPSAPMSRPAEYADHCSFGLGMVAVPSQPGVLLVGVLHHRSVVAEKHGSIYRSTDYGEHWNRIYPPGGQEIEPVTVLARDGLTPTIIYAGTEGSGMLRSTDAGLSWQAMAESIPALDYVRTIAAEPVPPYRVYALSWIGGNRDMYVSQDHGISWSAVTPPPDAPNTYQLLSTSAQPSLLYAASDQGLYRSADGAQSWQRAAGVLGYVPVYSLACVTATDRVILYAGTTGGYAQAVGERGLNLAVADGTLVGAGVYRYTTRRSSAYLPLVLKTYSAQ
jgi:photosystem II stability/assembly factor-like uncharacterized protein